MSLMLFSYLNVFAPGNVLISMSVQFWPGLHIEPFPSLEIFHLAVHSLLFRFVAGGACSSKKTHMTFARFRGA